jgi:hypothetical protein
MKDATLPTIVGPTIMGRRTFLKQAVTVAAGVGCVAGSFIELAAVERDRLLAALGLEPQQAAGLLDCEVVRRQMERIADTWPQRRLELAGATTPAQLRTKIRRAIQHDYANGNLVRVDGWYLAATEALIRALTAVAHA